MSRRVSETRKSEPRNFPRKILTVTASAGDADLPTDRVSGRSAVQSVLTDSPGRWLTVDGNACTRVGTTHFQSSGNPAFEVAQTTNDAAVEGIVTAEHIFRGPDYHGHEFE